MSDVMRALRDIQDGSTAKLLLAEILAMADREGILDRIRRLVPCSGEEVYRVLRVELGYALESGNRQRMICLLLDMLRECGWLREVDGIVRWDSADPPVIPEVGDGTLQARGASREDPQHRFFMRCVASVPAYLRGGPPSLLFDAASAGDWELFLGCQEFHTCRSLLLGLMGPENRPHVRLLVLCHGPGWDVELVVSQLPMVHITALDFTEVFHGTARERAETAHARHRQLGRPVLPVEWVGPDRWKGFGDPLPFGDGAFEAVFFSCGDPYIPRGLRSDVYREIGRVLAPGGQLGVLTRSRPDAGARHVSPFWLRISAQAHDFAESVCAGWEGFSDAEETQRMFSEVGLEAAGGAMRGMSLLGASLWLLRKPRTDA
ncbi:MAG: hypothetical protein WCI75_15065 [candidate division NC10 bacterium]